MILGLFGFLTANAAVLLATHALVMRMGPNPQAVRALVFLLVRLLIISAIVIVAGLTYSLKSNHLGIAAAIVLGLMLVRRMHRGLKAPTFAEVGLVSCIFASVVLARLLAQAWFFSPYAGDALSYHLPKVAEWVRAGGFTREMGVDTHVTFPAGFELVETWWVVFLHHDVLIEMAGIEFLVLGFSATYALAGYVGLEARGSFLAGLLYVMTPVVHLQATACLNDGPVAALFLAAVALVAWRAPFASVALAGGMGIGVKPTFLYAVPGLVLLWILVRKDSPQMRGSRLARALGAGSLAVGASWYLRNLLWFGNPIHPVGTAGLSGPHPIQSGARVSSFLGNLGDLIGSRIYDSAGSYTPLVTGMSGWGAIGFSCGAVALVALLRSDLKIRRLAASFLLSLVSVLTLVLHDPWSMRFVMFFPALLSIAVVRLASSCRPVLYLSGVAIALQFGATILPKELPFDVFSELARHPWRERTMARILDVWHEGDVIGYYVDNRNVAYLLYGPGFSKRVVYLRPTSADDLVRALRRENVRVLYAAPAKLELLQILQEGERRGWLKRIGRNFFSIEPDRLGSK